MTGVGRRYLSLPSEKKRKCRHLPTTAVVGTATLLAVTACWIGSYVSVLLNLPQPHRIDRNYGVRDTNDTEVILTGDAVLMQSEIFEKGPSSGASPVHGTRALVGPARDIEVVYAVQSIDLVPMVGIALLLHACTHNALKFFSANSKCEECIGLSEELAIVRSVLSRGYAPLAVTSSEKKRGCWGGGRDVDRVREALGEFRRILAMSSPTASTTHAVAVGASSGGRFAAVVAAEGIVNGAIVIVSGLGDNLHSRLVDMGPGLMPPLYLAPMTRDKGTTRAVRKDIKEMEERASSHPKYDAVSSTLPIFLDEDTCRPLAVDSVFLSGRVPNLSVSDAQAIVAALTDGEHLSRKTGMLIKDPTRSDWRDVLHQACGAVGGDEYGPSIGGEGCLRNQPLMPGRSPLAKALHRAWAFHEYCSEVIPLGLNFIEDTLKMRVQQ